MLHTIRYFGNFEKGFHQLRADTDWYFDREGKEKKNLNEVSDKVNGLHFLYMQMPAQEFVVVGVDRRRARSRSKYERIVLRAPVLLIPERHTDDKGFASDPHFGDESAMRLLVDMIIANPERRDALGRLVQGLGRGEPST